MTEPTFADDLARAHELADQAARMIEKFGKRLVGLAAEFEAGHRDEAWNARVGGSEAWEPQWEAVGLDALWNRLDDLQAAVEDAEARAAGACSRAEAMRRYSAPVDARAAR